MSIKTIFTKYKLSAIVVSIILGLALISGGITAGILLTRQSTPSADALTDTVYINADGTTATSSDYDWALEIYYSSTTATTCRLDSVTRSSSSTATTIVIPDTVIVGDSSKTITTMRDAGGISNGVFSNVRAYIISVTLPKTQTDIGVSAFYGCNNLTNVTIPDGVSGIGDRAFYNCESLTSVTMPDSVTWIGTSAFNNCGITSVIIPDGVTSIGDRAFYGCNSLTNIIIPDSVIRIGSYVFEYCKSLISITIGKGLTSIGSQVFEYCENLISINVDTNNTSYSSQDGVLFNKNKSTLIKYPEGISGEYIIPNSVTSIGNNAFYNCSLSSITILDSVTSIGDDAFFYSSRLNSITIGKNVTSIGASAFGRAGLTSITIPDSVTSIGDDAFFYCFSLTNATIGKGLTSIGDHVFRSCSRLTSINVDTENKNFCSQDGVLFNKNKTRLIEYPERKSGTTYSIPNTVTIIGDNAIDNCYNLISVTIPNSVISIGNSAFSFCERLSKVMIGNSVTSIGDSAFYDCDNLSSITIPKSVTSIGSSVFYYCTRLSSVTFENELTTSTQIGNTAFAGGNTNAMYYFDKLSTYNLALQNTNKFSTNDPSHFVFNGPTITVNSTTGGTATGGGQYDADSSVTLTATPNAGYQFVNWTNSDGSVLSKANPYTFTVTQSMTITANFTQSNYTVIMESSGYPSKLGGLIGGFENTGWSSVNYSTTYVRSGDYSLRVDAGTTNPEVCTFSQVAVALDETNKDHIFYFQYWGYQETLTPDATTQIYWPEEEPSFGAITLGPAGQWNMYSFYGSRSANALNPAVTRQVRIDFDNRNQTASIWFDDFLMLDLTEIFGAGNEPSKAWCDANIISGTNVQTVQYNVSTNLENRPGSTPEAYNFLGWSTTPKSTSTTNQNVSYSNGASINNITSAGSTITLYGVWQIKSYGITVQPNNAAFGNTMGTGTYNHGATAILTATPSEGYRFVRWQNQAGQQVSTTPTYTVQVTSSETYTAIFERITYTLNVYSANESYGTVSGGGTYDYHQSITITATPKTGYAVDYWLVNGVRENATGNTYTFTITQNTTITVYFKSSLAQARATAGGEVRIQGNDIGLTNTSKTVTFTALAYNGYYLIGWYLDNTLYTSKDRTITLTQAQAKGVCVTAVFSTNPNGTPTYTFNREETTTITSTIGGEARMVGYGGEYNETTLIAITQKGYKFTGWYIDGTQYSISENIIIDTNTYKGKVLEARFELINNDNINEDVNN